MGKRKTDNLLSPSEIRQSTQQHYDGYIKNDQQKKAIQPVPQTDPRRIPTDSRIRPCWSCDCTNVQGYCDNYFLYAVLRDMCGLPVKEVV
jgi:hypothetical protein